MAARHDDIAANEMDDQSCDQTRQNSAGQVSNTENKVKVKFKTLFKIKTTFPDAPILNG